MSMLKFGHGPGGEPLSPVFQHFQPEGRGGNTRGPGDFLKRLKIIAPAISLGGVETTVCALCVTSHAKMKKEERQRIGVTDALLRLSVGIEDARDLIADMGQALEGF